MPALQQPYDARSADMRSDAPSWLQEIDHTGDIGIRVRAESLPQLFERAALGTFSVLTDLSSVRPKVQSSVTVTDRDLEALLVRWLSELNFRHTVDHHLYCRFTVDDLDKENDEYTLRATVQGEPIDPDRHTVYTEIKAITFHGLDVQETDDGWTVQVIFDM